MKTLLMRNLYRIEDSLEKVLKFNALGIYAGLKEREEDKKATDSIYIMKSDAALEVETWRF